ncbi:MAG: lytic transglycosylase domain-containing protein [Candidatus Sedimenticola endophacoides]
MSRLIVVHAVLLCAGYCLPHSSLAQSTLASPPAFRVVAGEYGVPYSLLFAVALTESGRSNNGKFLPWPWTLNVRGESRWYESRQAVVDDLRRLIAAGETPDVGLMQVNWRYHADRLGDPEQAVDPWFNLRAGASVLVDEYSDTGDWWKAVGRYHSRRPERAAHYTERVAGWYRKIH